MKIISFDSSNKGIAKNALLGFIFQFIIKFKGVLILPLIVHYLPREVLGEWRLISTSVAIILPLISLNVLDGAGMFFSADIEPRRVKIKFYTLLHLTLFLSTLLILVSLFLRKYFQIFNDYTIALLLYFFTSVLVKLSIFLFQTYQKSSKLLIVNLFIEYGGAAVTILLIFLGIKNIYTLLLPIIFLNIIMSFYLFPLIVKEIGYGFYFNKKFIKKVLPISIPLIPVYLTEWLLSSVGIYFLQYYYSIDLVGSYSVLLSIASLLLTLRATLQFFWFSTCSNMLQNERFYEFRKILTEIIKVYLVISVLALAIYGFFSHDLINILANSSYSMISIPLYFTAFGYVFLIFSTIWNGMLYSLGKTKVILWNYIYTSAAIILLSLILVKFKGIEGASISYLFGNVLLFILMFRSNADVKPDFTKNEKIVNCVLVIIPILISVFQFLNIDFQLKRILGVLFIFCILFVVYLYRYIVPIKLINLIRN